MFLCFSKKRGAMYKFFGLGLLLAFLIIPVHAEDPEYELQWSSLDGGSMQLHAGDYSLAGTVGQAEGETANTMEGDYGFDNGFWYEVVQDETGETIRILYMPIIMKAIYGIATETPSPTDTPISTMTPTATRIISDIPRPTMTPTSIP